MTEKELHMAVMALCGAVGDLIDNALDMPATVELCVFTGKLGAVYDVLCALKDAGVPMHDPDEEPHPL